MISGVLSIYNIVYPLSNVQIISEIPLWSPLLRGTKRKSLDPTVPPITREDAARQGESIVSVVRYIRYFKLTSILGNTILLGGRQKFSTLR